MKNKYVGSDFDDFLQDEGIFAEVEAAAIKKVVAWQIIEMMKRKQLSKSKLAKVMHTSRSALDRLLDPTNVSITLQTLERVALVLGKKLKIEFL